MAALATRTLLFACSCKPPSLWSHPKSIQKSEKKTHIKTQLGNIPIFVTQWGGQLSPKETSESSAKASSQRGFGVRLNVTKDRPISGTPPAANPAGRLTSPSGSREGVSTKRSVSKGPFNVMPRTINRSHLPSVPRQNTDGPFHVVPRTILTQALSPISLSRSMQSQDGPKP